MARTELVRHPARDKAVDRIYFKPWRGKKFRSTRLLIVSESAYDWLEGGKRCTPLPIHPRATVLENIKDPHVKYFSQLTRALCGNGFPSVDDRRKAWSECAYTIFVQSAVGLGPGRPTHEQFQEAGPPFLKLIERIRPWKVIVTGKDLWRNMPNTSAHHRGKLEAYRLRDGTLVWCLPLPHPANRTTGFNWRRVNKEIRWFKSLRLPRRNYAGKT